EMTGNFTLTLPIMLACGIAAQLAKRITYGSIYTTKLLRRGIDIERPKAIGALRALTVAQVMQPLAQIDGQPRLFRGDRNATVDRDQFQQLIGPVTLVRRPQVLFGDEDLEQARRQLVLYGRDGLPVLSHDGHLQGWLTRADILNALTNKLKATETEIQQGAAAVEGNARSVPAAGPEPTRPLPGYELLEVRVHPDSPALDRSIAEIPWPAGSTVVALTQAREVRAAQSGMRLQAGERVLVLAPLPDTVRS
ncbi:MAG: hypothetical protein J2O48_11200, partial [Solirubrobacterales bacterium]|nr:hypothetical protein [Solirubrobacterales bacterium]